MSESNSHIVIKTTETDNVGIIVNSGGLKKGDSIKNGIQLRENIPMGHKVALQNIGEGEKIIRYGQPIGFANQIITAGEWVNASKIILPEPPDLKSFPLPETSIQKSEPLEGFTFLGYRNPDGSVGTKNVLGITTSVQCVAGFTQFVVKKIKQEILPKYPNVDDVVALNHSYGCGVAIHVPAAVVPIRTLQNISTNPNFGGEVLIIGLGCEKLRPESLLPANGTTTDSPATPEISNIMVMQDDAFSGFSAMAEGIIQMAETRLKKLNQRKREICPASELVVGMQCGGSDAFSGITSNPAAGFAADLIVRAGGSVLFSEVTEVRDAVHLLVPRAINAEVGNALINEMKWYDDYLMLGQADRTANPAPGNKTGGLSNIVEKALGSVAKSGTSPIVDVLGPVKKRLKKWDGNFFI